MSKCVFFSRLNTKDKIPTSSGCREMLTFGYLPDPETGEDVLQVVGSEDLYERAQLARPDDLYTLLQKTGVEASNIENLRVTKDYAESLIDDFCSAPRSLIEAHSVIHKAQESFDQLPLDVKQEFDNSPGQMLKSLQDNTFEARISRFLPKKQEDSIPEVNNNETK